MTKNSRSSIVTAVILVILFSVAAGLIFNATKESQVKKATIPIKTNIDLELDTKKDKKQLDTDFGPYMAKLQEKIKSKWFPPKGDNSNRVKLRFNVAENGIMNYLRIKKHSGITAVDQAAINAVRNAAPFAPLPEGAPKSVDIDFSFDYNVYKKDKVNQL